MNTFILVVWAFFGNTDGTEPKQTQLLSIGEFTGLDACEKAAEKLGSAIHYHVCLSQQ